MRRRSTSTFATAGVACVALALALTAAEATAQAPAANPSQADIIRALQSPRRSLRVEPTTPGAAAPDAGAASAAPPEGATPAGGAAPASAGPTPSAAGAIDLAILFEFGSAALTPAGRGALDTLAGALADPTLRDARIRIEGHTDAVGRPEVNQRLSAERAAAVRRYLVDTRGIAGDRLVALGLGQTQLALPDRPADAANRRVRIVNLD